MSILNVPVQINRGTSVPPLKEGEPFFNLSNNYLYIGGTDVNISGQSAKTLRIVNNKGLFDLSATEPVANIGGFQVSSGSWVSSTMLTISGIRPSNVGKTVLSTEMYGKTFPSSPVKGQLFFKLAE